MTFTTRFAPSPTGYLHVGGARTALYCWLQARKLGGKYVLRIEDTDRERSTSEAVDAILESMEWLGLDADEGPFYQTDRFDDYAKAIEQLMQSGHAYRCDCSRERLDKLRETQRANQEKPRYDGHCRDRKDVSAEGTVVRFRTPLEGATEFTDLIRGTLTFSNDELDDLVIARSDGTPTYNLTVVVDDAAMNITHVIRGDDHINNTPKQVNIFDALGYSVPVFAHVPMILGEDGSRLSKRHGAVSVLEYRKAGFLPDALLNYLVRLGWSHGDQEVFTREQMVELFDIADVNRAASTFNPEKLKWLNQRHMQMIEPQELADLLGAELTGRGVVLDDATNLVPVVEAFNERASTLVEMADACAYLFFDVEEYDAKAAKTHLRPVSLEPLESVHQMLEELEGWSEADIDQVIKDVVEKHETKFPKVGQPIRVAVTGSSQSPGIGLTLSLLGRERSLERISRALAFIRKRIEDAAS